MSDLSIIIPHRGSPLGLWATITSCEQDLQKSEIDYNYILVCNGEEKISPDIQNVIHYLDKAKKLKLCIKQQTPLSPPEARQLGANASDSKYLFFLDNHCLVWKNYFKRALLDFASYDIDLLHSTTQYYCDDVKYYQYKLKLKHNFWAEATTLPQHASKPYRIAAGGHGGFAVKRSTWEEIGGYGPSGLFVGYGGEEIYADLKLWLLGKSVYLDPLVLHHHFAGDRGYNRHYTDDYFINMLVCANVIGGSEWMYKVFDSFITPGRFIRIKSDVPMYELMLKAEERSGAHARELAGKRTKSLDELLLWFRAESIPC